MTGYCALVDSRRVGLDVTAFIGISMTPTAIDRFEAQLRARG